MTDYVIAIPSYKRPDIIGPQTLSTLERLGADRDLIHVFVADDAEREIYEHAIGDYRIIVGVRGISSQRKYYHEFFPVGTRIISLDDDIADILEKAESKLAPTSLNFEEIIDIGFGVCEKENARLWGINPTANAFYMKDQVSVGLRYICANFMGSYAGDWVFTDPERRMTPTGEDHHSTLRSFTKYGSVVRIEYLCPKTKYFAKGGIDACVSEDGHTRFERHARQLQRVASLYPDLATTYTKAGERMNLKLKPVTRSRYARENV